MRRKRWMTRKERDAMREEIAEPGGIGAWIRAEGSAAAQAEQRARRRKMNALA